MRRIAPSGKLVAMAKTKAPDLSPAAVVEALRAFYGEPEWRPHGDAMSELVLTLLSQNTSDANSGRAFSHLLQRFPDWQAMLAAPTAEIEDAIRPGGLAPTKAPRLKGDAGRDRDAPRRLRARLSQGHAFGRGARMAALAAGRRPEDGGLRPSSSASAGPACPSTRTSTVSPAASASCRRS